MNTVNGMNAAPKEARAAKRSLNKVGQSQKSQVRADQGGAQRGGEIRAPQSHTKTKEREGLARNQLYYFCLFYFISLVAVMSPPPRLPTGRALPLRVRAKNSKTVKFRPRSGAPWARAQCAFCGTGQIEKGKRERSSTTPSRGPDRRTDKARELTFCLCCVVIYQHKKKIDAF